MYQLLKPKVFHCRHAVSNASALNALLILCPLLDKVKIIKNGGGTAVHTNKFMLKSFLKFSIRIQEYGANGVVLFQRHIKEHTSRHVGAITIMWVLQGRNCQKLILNWTTCQWATVTVKGKRHSHLCVNSFQKRSDHE